MQAVPQGAPRGSGTSTTRSVDSRGSSRAGHSGEAAREKPCRCCRRRNRGLCAAAPQQPWFCRFCQVSGGSPNGLSDGHRRKAPLTHPRRQVGPRRLEAGSGGVRVASPPPGHRTRRGRDWPALVPSVGCQTRPVHSSNADRATRAAPCAALMYRTREFGPKSCVSSGVRFPPAPFSHSACAPGLCRAPRACGDPITCLISWSTAAPHPGPGSRASVIACAASSSHPPPSALYSATRLVASSAALSAS